MDPLTDDIKPKPNEREGTVCRYVPEPKTVPPTISRIFATNFLGLILFFALLSWWIYRYTDWFDAFTSLLAFGGIFSWLAFLSKLLSEETIKALQLAIDKKMKSNNLTMGLAVCLGLLVILGLFFGSFELKSRIGDIERQVSVSKIRSNEISVRRLSPGTRLRVVTLTSFWKPQKLSLRVSGYPERVLILFPFEKEELEIPDAFLRPVLLIRPTANLLRTANNFKKTHPLSIEFEIKPPGGKQIKHGPFAFDGKAWLIGSDTQVSLPDELTSSWRVESNDWKILNSWRYPTIHPVLTSELLPGTHVRVRMFSKSGPDYASKIAIAARPARLSDFPQVEDLNASQ